MKKIIISFMVGLISLAATISFAGDFERPGKLMAATNNWSDELRPPEDAKGTGTLVEVNPETGEGTRVAGLELPGLSLAFNHADGLLYGILVEWPEGPWPKVPLSRLVTISPIDGTTNIIGYVRDVYDSSIDYSVGGMSFDGEGNLYGIVGKYDLLVSIDPETAVATPVGAGLGTTVSNFGGAILDGKFYFLTGLSQTEIMVWNIDLESGAASSVGPTNIVVEGGGVGITVDGEGRLLAAMSNVLYEVDKDTGAATPIGSIDFNVISGLGFVDAIASQCPCDQTADGEPWKNHKQYVRCVRKTAKSLAGFDRDGWKQTKGLLAETIQNQCGDINRDSWRGRIQHFQCAKKAAKSLAPIRKKAWQFKSLVAEAAKSQCGMN